MSFQEIRADIAGLQQELGTLSTADPRSRTVRIWIQLLRQHMAQAREELRQL